MLVPLLNLQAFVIFCFWRCSNPFSPTMNVNCIFHSATQFPVPCCKDSSSHMLSQPSFAVRQAQLPA